MTYRARLDGIGWPGLGDADPRPRSVCAAVAPRHTTARGRTAASSDVSHGGHARTSPAVGLL